jgi:hypothetical protein
LNAARSTYVRKSADKRYALSALSLYPVYDGGCAPIPLPGSYQPLRDFPFSRRQRLRDHGMQTLLLQWSLAQSPF